jgi:hypothetical protein
MHYGTSKDDPPIDSDDHRHRGATQVKDTYRVKAMAVAERVVRRASPRSGLRPGSASPYLGRDRGDRP